MYILFLYIPYNCIITDAKITLFLQTPNILLIFLENFNNIKILFLHLIPTIATAYDERRISEG